MTTDRRSPRRVADRVVPVQIEPGIPAIVLDSSEAGLRFRALRPVMQTGPMRFSFIDNGHPFEATGELIWIDPARQTGGLSFASLPQATRERIVAWITSAPASEIAAPAASRPAVFSQPAAAQPFASYVPAPPGLPFPQSVGRGYAMFEDDPQYLENPPTRFFPGFLTGFIVAALIAVFLFFSLGDSGSALLARWRTGNATSTASQPAPPEPASAPVAPAETSAAPAPQLPATVGSEDAPEAPLPPIQPPLVTQPAPAAERPQAPTSSSAATADAGDAELARAQSYLNQRSGGQASRAAAVPLLWSAVEKGNLTALITLGDLYARGDGVPKNCNQARVLLRAAAEKGSREASQQLAQVVRSCR